MWGTFFDDADTLDSTLDDEDGRDDKKNIYFL